jgi:ATP-binding cassette subfamily B protein
MIGAIAIRSLMMYRRGMLIEEVSQNVVYDLRTGLYAHMQELSYAFYDSHHIGEIMSRMTGDIEGVRMFIINGVVGVVENMLMFVLSLIGMSLMSWQLTMCMLIFCPVIAYVATRLHKRIRPAHMAVREQNAVLNTRTQENIAGVRVVKAFAREEHEKEAFSVDNKKVLNNNLQVTWIWSTFFPLMDMIASCALPVLILVGSWLVMRGALEIGTLVGATGFVWMLIAPMRQLANFVNITTNGLVSSEKLIYYMDLGSQVKNPAKPQEPVKREGRVDFDHVTFKYGDKAVLHDIDLHVEPGQVIAVMGATGAGKSTLITLLGRYYDVASGSIRVDKVDVREQNLQKLLKEVPNQKLVLGVPLYTRLWKDQQNADGSTELTSKALPMDKVKQWLQEKGIRPVYDEATGQNYAEYYDANEKATYKIWVEDDLSLNKRAKLAADYKLAGIGTWSTGTHPRRFCRTLRVCRLCACSAEIWHGFKIN